MFTLAEQDGQWKIVSKIYHTSPQGTQHKLSGVANERTSRGLLLVIVAILQRPNFSQSRAAAPEDDGTAVQCDGLFEEYLQADAPTTPARKDRHPPRKQQYGSSPSALGNR